MTTRNVAYRLKSEGKAELIRDAGEVKTALAGAYDGAAASADKATSAAERLERRNLSLAQAARANAEQEARRASFDQVIGANLSARPGMQRLEGTSFGLSARDSASVFEEQALAMERAEASAARLKAALDPVGAAEDRLNAELRETIELQKRGLITTDQMTEAQRRAKVEFDQTTAAIERQGKGLTRQVLASRLNLARQGADVAVTAAMGMNPAMIAIQQGPQILDALATSGIKASGSLLLLGGAVTALSAGVVVLGAEWLHGEDIALQYERAVTGIGRTAGLTAGELEALTVTAAAQGEVSEKSARQQASAYLATGRIGSEIIGGLIRIGKDYASVFGQDAEAATTSLAKAMMEPDKAGRELTRTMGLLDQAQLDQIDSLMKAGDLLAAQKILLEALDRAVSGHAEKTGEITNAWDAVGRSISNAVDQFGKWLYLTEGEKLQNFIDQRARVERAGGPRSESERQRYDEWGERASGILGRREQREAQEERRAAEARRNRDAQLAEDRKEKPKANRSAEREAEREAREALQRKRREEDIELQRDLQIAQALGDLDRGHALEREIALLGRRRQLEDDGLSVEAARTKALAEQAELSEAQAAGHQREAARISEMASMEADRLEGLDRFVLNGERRVDLAERIKRYQELEYDLVTATNMAKSDQLMIEEARLRVMERSTQEAEAENRLTLARLRGDDAAERRLSIEDRTARRARDIEKRGGLNYGDGADQARSEIQAELDAEATGARRAWLKDFIGDIRQGGIAEALGRQFESAADRLVNRLIDQLFEMDWNKIFGSTQGGIGGGGGGWADVISKGVNFLFGRNANGTDYWTGGPTWVGENGPELLDLPRGSKVTEHNRSMVAATGGSAGRQPAVTNNYFSGNLMTPDFWAEIRRGDQMAASRGASQGAGAAVNVVRRTAAMEQRETAMLKA